MFLIRLKQFYLNTLLLVYPFFILYFLYQAYDLIDLLAANNATLLTIIGAYGIYYTGFIVFIVVFYIQKPRLNIKFITMGIFTILLLCIPKLIHGLDPALYWRIWRSSSLYLFVIGITITKYLLLYLLAIIRR